MVEVAYETVFDFYYALKIANREVTEDGKELLFDHGAPFFSVSNAQVLSLVREWESRGLVAEWSENFGAFDCISHDFVDIQQVYYNSFNNDDVQLCYGFHPSKFKKNMLELTIIASLFSKIQR